MSYPTLSTREGTQRATLAGMEQRQALATAPALAREGWPWGMGQRPM